MKLSNARIVNQFGREALTRLPKPYLYAAEGGHDPAVVAQLVGFPSADAMLQALADAPNLAAAIGEETDRRMLGSPHGQRMLDGVSLKEAADGRLVDRRREVVSADSAR